MRSTIMMGTALLASMTVVGAFVPEAAAASRGAARPTFRAIPHQPAFRPMPYRPSTAFRTPARTVQRPNPNVRPRVLTSRDIHPKVPLLHSAPGSVAGRTPAAHPLPAHDRALVPHAPIPVVSARE